MAISVTALKRLAWGLLFGICAGTPSLADGEAVERLAESLAAETTSPKLPNPFVGFEGTASLTEQVIADSLDKTDALLKAAAKIDRAGLTLCERIDRATLILAITQHKTALTLTLARLRAPATDMPERVTDMADGAAW